MREIKSHTAVRGIAALCVVICHFREVLPDSLNPDRLTLFFAHGYLWVDCFFILSGFILSYVYGATPAGSMANLRKFLIARFARVYPLHIAILFGLAGMFLALPLFSHQRLTPNWWTFGLNILDIHAWGFLSAYDWNFPSWSISVEFAAYLIYPLACMAILKWRLPTLLAISVSFVGALFIGRDHWEQLALARGLPMFLTGMLLFHLPIRKSSALQLISVAALIGSLHLGFDTPCAIAFCSIIYFSREDDGPSSFLSAIPFQRLGEWSFSIYMLHIPLKILINLLAPRLISAPLFCSLVCLTILSGAASYYCFEMPCRRFIKGQSRDDKSAETSGYTSGQIKRPSGAR